MVVVFERDAAPDAAAVFVIAEPEGILVMSVSHLRTVLELSSEHVIVPNADGWITVTVTEVVTAGLAVMRAVTTHEPGEDGAV